MRRRTTAALAGLFLALTATPAAGWQGPQPAATPVATPAPSHAPAAGTAPESDAAENLQVLPRDWTRRQVIERVMRSWTAALGVRCPHCHVGEEGQDLGEFDFASDAKPEKARAREMLRMLEEINRRLAAMPEMHGAKPASATCATCHHGLPRPLRIEDVFDETMAAGGLDAALTKYRELRAEYLTRGAYDFGAMPLVRIARARLAAEDAAGAGRVLDMAVELGHDTLSMRATLAEAALAAGDRAAAVGHLEKAMGMATNASERAFIEQQLRSARGEDAQRPQ